MSENRTTVGSRKHKIILACQDVISNEGFAATSMRQVAKASGISLGTLMHHFPSKGQMLSACISHVIEEWAAGAVEVLSVPGSAEERLNGLISWNFHSEVCDKMWRIYMAFAHEAVFDTEIESVILEDGLQWDDALEECIDEAIHERVGSEAVLPEGEAKRIGKVLSTLMIGVAFHIHGRLGRWTRDTGTEICQEYLETEIQEVARQALGSMTQTGEVYSDG